MPVSVKDIRRIMPFPWRLTLEYRPSVVGRRCAAGQDGSQRQDHFVSKALDVPQPCVHQRSASILFGYLQGSVGCGKDSAVPWLSWPENPVDGL